MERRKRKTHLQHALGRCSLCPLERIDGDRSYLLDKAVARRIRIEVVANDLHGERLAAARLSNEEYGHLELDAGCQDEHVLQQRAVLRCRANVGKVHVVDKAPLVELANPGKGNNESKCRKKRV